MSAKEKPPRFTVRSALLLAALVSSLSGQSGKPQEKDPLHTGEPVPPGCVAIVDGSTVSEQTFIDEVIRAFGAPGREGDEVRKNLMNENIVIHTLRKRGLSVTEKRLKEEIAWVEEQVKKKGSTLVQYLKDRGVPRATFERKLRSSLGLEMLVHMDAKLPQGKKPTRDSMALWLMDHRDRAVLVMDPAKLDASVAFTVNGIPVSKRRFVEDALPVLDAKLVRKKVIDPLVQGLLVERMLKLHGLALTEADLIQQWQSQKKEFESKPSNKGLVFDDIVRQQTGSKPEDFQRTPGFRLRASLSLIGRKVITPAVLKAGYEKHKGFYGPQMTIRHLMIRASDRPDPKKKLRSFEECKPVVMRIHKELTSGAQRFEDAVRLYSEDLGTKYKGGLLPVFTPRNNRMEQTMLDAVMQLEVDTISKPIKTSYGWHIVRVEAREPAPSLAEVENDLRRRLGGKMFADQWSKAKIGIDVRL